MQKVEGLSRSIRPLSETLFEPLPWAVLRAPLAPVEAYPRGRTEGGDLQTLLAADPIARTAIAVASESLDAALERAPRSSREALKLQRKVLRYVIRMCTRPTPFGLFAGVGLVEWGSTTSIRLADGVRTRSRPDIRTGSLP
jgi:hypothetical protein